MSANSNAKEFRKRLGTHDADINAIVDEMLATMERLEFELEAASKRQAASYKESVEMATLAAHEIEALRKERDELKERLNYYSYTMGESCERADDVLEDRDRLRMANAELRARLADASVPASEESRYADKYRWASRRPTLRLSRPASREPLETRTMNEAAETAKRDALAGRMEALVRRAALWWNRLRFGSETMTPRQLSRRYARGACCADCRKPIHMNDDAGVCIQCGGMNVRRTD